MTVSFCLSSAGGSSPPSLRFSLLPGFLRILQAMESTVQEARGACSQKPRNKIPTYLIRLNKRREAGGGARRQGLTGLPLAGGGVGWGAGTWCIQVPVDLLGPQCGSSAGTPKDCRAGARAGRCCVRNAPRASAETAAPHSPGAVLH